MNFIHIEEEGAEDKKPPVNERIIPGLLKKIVLENFYESFYLEYVFILEASNEYLRQRIMHLPEKVVAGTHNTELEFNKKRIVLIQSKLTR